MHMKYSGSQSIFKEKAEQPEWDSNRQSPTYMYMTGTLKCLLLLYIHCTHVFKPRVYCQQQGVHKVHLGDLCCGRGFKASQSLAIIYMHQCMGIHVQCQREIMTVICTI